MLFQFDPDFFGVHAPTILGLQSRKPEARPVVQPTPPATPKAASSPKLDQYWLIEQVAQYNVLNKGPFTDSDLATQLQALLKSKKSNDALQAELFDLLGDFDFVGLLLEKRSALAQVRSSTKPNPQKAFTGAGNNGNAPPLIGVTVRMEGESKQRGKKNKNKAAASGSNPNWLASMGQGGLQAHREQQLNQTFSQDQLYAESSLGEGVFSGAGRKFVLPKGTERRQFKTYEEVEIPVVPPPPLRNDTLVPVTELDENGQKVRL